MQQDSRQGSATGERTGSTILLTLLTALALLLPVAARADLPLYSLGMGGGIGGLFHEEHVGEPLRSKQVGKFNSGVWWVDVTWSRRSNLTFGARIHHLRAGLGDNPRVGTVSLLPTVLTVGYRFQGPAARAYGYLAAGAGIASANFDRSGYESSWEGEDGGEIRITEKHPPVLEVLFGGLVRLSDDFSAEIGLAAVMIDTQVRYQPPVGENGLPNPAYAYSVKGRHLVATIGFRWWFEWW